MLLFVIESGALRLFGWIPVLRPLVLPPTECRERLTSIAILNLVRPGGPRTLAG
jgi:hypothetical protein